MTSVQLYDNNTCDQIDWPTTESGVYARSFLLPLLREGVSDYIANVKTRLFLLAVDDLILPLTVNEQEYDNSYIVSNYYAIHALKEKNDKGLPTPLIRLAAGVMKWLKVNQTVLVNNWLVTNNLLPELTSKQLKEITGFLRIKFPQHYLMFRNVTTFAGGHTMDALRAEGFRLLSSRSVFVYNPSNKERLSSKVHYHHRRDLRLLEKLGYELVRKEGLLSSDVPRIGELYRLTYLDAHTSYSPQYTEKFLVHALESSFFDFVGVRKGGVLDGIFGYYLLKGTMATPFFGFESRSHASGELYRLMTMLIIKEAERHGAVLNDGSGGASSKKFRGMEPHPEFVALYDRHLPLSQRLIWHCIERLRST